MERGDSHDTDGKTINPPPPKKKTRRLFCYFLLIFANFNVEKLYLHLKIKCNQQIKQ